MPFKTTEYDRAFAEGVHAVVYDLARARSPLLSQIAIETSIGPASSVVDSREGGRLDLPEQSVGFGMTFDHDAVRSGDIEALVVQMYSASDQLAQELVRMLLENVSKVTESTGNVVKTKGKFTFEHFYEALDKMEWS